MQIHGKMTVLLFFCKICKCILFICYFSISQIASTCVYISKYYGLEHHGKCKFKLKQSLLYNIWAVEKNILLFLEF